MMSNQTPKDETGSRRDAAKTFIDRIPIVELGHDEHRVVEETSKALRADPNLFQRGNILVRVSSQNDNALEVSNKLNPRQKPHGPITVEQIPNADLRTRICRYVRLRTFNGKSWEPAHPPTWLVNGVESRGHWPVRQLNGISSVPVIRSDGSVFQTAGYDDASGVLFRPDDNFEQIPDEVNEEDAVAALGVLGEVIEDFPFETPAHRAAWFAALLTPFARFAYAGPTPLFMFDANIRGAGKTLLGQAIGTIFIGQSLPATSYTANTEELRKLITSLVLEARPIVFFDNLAGQFGNHVIDRLLTSEYWSDRLLGKTKTINVPQNSIFMATGNNVEVAADTARRVIPCRIEIFEERPEQREGFKHPDLLRWIAENRGRLVIAATTVLSAYLKRGKPDQGLVPLGSFEGWSMVRHALVWAGLEDPCDAQAQFVAKADTTHETLRELIEAWIAFDQDNRGIVLSKLLDQLFRGQVAMFDGDHDSVIAMRSAVESLATGRGDPSARSLAARLRSFRKRPIELPHVGTVFLEVDESMNNRGGSNWRLFDVSTRKPWVRMTGESGDCDSGSLPE